MVLKRRTAKRQRKKLKPASGLDLDVKPEKNVDGRKSVPDWRQRSPVCVGTPSGGIHVWFQSDGRVRNSQGKIAPGVDVRGDGGYLIVPPSPGYRFVQGSLDDIEQLPPFPQDLLDKLGGKHDTADNPNNPKCFNAAVLAVIDFLGGDRRTGECLCPIHNDHNPSLSVGNGDEVPVVLHCFACKRDREIVEYLRREGAWPSSAHFKGPDAAAAADETRSAEERLRYAVDIYEALFQSYGRDMAPLLKDYFQRRGLTRVPPEALVAMPPEWVRATGSSTDKTLSSPNVGMVLALRDKRGELQGVQATWLNHTLTGKREEQPQRQTYGLLKGNFLELEFLDYEHRLDRLIIGEGVETAEAAAQLTDLLGPRLPAIATAGGMAKVNPPEAQEYIICVDVDDDGGSRKNAGLLAQRLVGHVVRIATPIRPKGGKHGFDWNDALIDAKGDPAKLKKLASAIIEAPKFEDVATDQEKREMRLNALAHLKLDDPLAYEAERAPAHRELKIRLSVLDTEVERRCQLLREEREREAPPAPVNMELLEASARDIIDCQDVLALFAKDCSQIIAGEEPVLKIQYLACTTRLFDKAMHLAIKGASSLGKSETRKTVLSYMPPEAVINFTTVSEKALLYYEDDFPHKILSMGEAHGREESDLQNYLLRELMSEGKLIYPVSQKVGGRIVTVTIKKNGPVCFLVTTTRSQLNPENETRMLSLELDDSEQQTRRVVEKVAALEGLNLKPKTDFKPWRDYQRWLAAGEVRVKVPYALTLARLIRHTKAPRLRRDIGQLLRAVKAHALLHRAHRRCNDAGEIIATIRDYAVIRQLMADLLASGVELKMRKEIADTIEAIKSVIAAPWTGGGDHDTKGASSRQVADLLRLDTNAAWRRLQVAENAGFVVNLENRSGRPGRYRITGQTLTEESGELLPTAPEVEQALQQARAAHERDRAAGRGQQARAGRV
jgi:hypothetical protein